MKRRQSAPWVVLGHRRDGKPNKMGVFGKSRHIGGYELSLCEYDAENDRPTSVYMTIMFCNLDTLKSFRDLCNDCIRLWESDNEANGTERALK
ncbi:MAG: hypothetical protein IKP40_13955 [Clostridia bacterium]|nr:hypothetical protein [Clostridia bacterium]